MTSLTKYLRDHGVQILNEEVEGYIKELESHMFKYRVVAGTSQTDTAIALTVGEMLKFLRGETK